MSNMLDAIYDYMHKSKKRAKKRVKKKARKKTRKESLGLRMLRAVGNAPSAAQISHMAKRGLVPYYARGQVSWDTPHGQRPIASTEHIRKAMASMPKSKKRAKKRTLNAAKMRHPFEPKPVRLPSIAGRLGPNPSEREVMKCIEKVMDADPGITIPEAAQVCLTGVPRLRAKFDYARRSNEP